MKPINIFDKEYIQLFVYGNDGIETFDRIMFSLGYTYDNISTNEARESALHAIKQMLNYDLIRIHHWGEDNNYFKTQNLSNREILLVLRAKWKMGLDIPDFYGLVIFNLSDWYIIALEEEGMTHTTDWRLFVENKIGDLKQWIEEKRPKK